MKKFLSSILLIVSIVSIFCSCQKLWHPIELSQSEVTFDAAGGTYTVEAINRTGWWINGIRVTGTDTYYYPDTEEWISCIGDGISAKIGTEKNTVVITVDPSSERHDWTVGMESGDVFTSIQVRQN